MNSCASRYCQFNLNGCTLPNSKKVLCPFCRHTTYCSQRCRDLDWTLGHKNQCAPTEMLSSQELAYSDKASTLREMKRSPQEFEFVSGGEPLGKGSFGCVKLVRDRLNGQLYAMKIITKKDIFEFCSIENLKREIRIQRKLQHVNVTQLFHYFEDREKVYLILEYAEHGSLFQSLRRKQRFSEQEALKVFTQTCNGIEYLHQQGIIHRDLKPENILLDIQDTVKICDFGWSAENMNTKRSTFCGTIDYMAPEMIEDKPHDHTLDLWCLGILLYELLHGYAPFKGKNDIEKCNNIVKQQPILYDMQLSPEVRDLIANLIQYNPKDRLSMNAIRRHPWFAGSTSKRKRQHNNSIDYPTNMLSKSTATSNLDTSFQEYRKTRKSRNNSIPIQEPRIQPELTLMQKIMQALGCVSRDPNQS